MQSTHTHAHLENTHTEVAKIDRPEVPASNQVFDTIMFSNLINVLIVIAFLIWLCRKFNLLSVIAKKRDEILETIRDLEQQRKVKKNQLEQTKNKVKNVSQEITKIIDEGEQVAESLSERILKDAEEEAAALYKKAHATIETERKMASNRVVGEVTSAAFIIAEQHIKEAIDDRLHQKYIDEFIENLDNIKV